MAGDWIKMRVNLVTHPKVLAIAEELASDGRYCDWSLLSGFVPALGGSEEDAKLEYESALRVTRYVTVCALLRFWGYANEHADDECISNLRLSNIDEIVQVPGFGSALASVGWVIEGDGGRGISLPDFNKFNEVAKIRTSSAERQKRYRERQKESKSDANGDVTRDVTVTPREEKRREDISTTDVVDKRDRKSRIASKPDEVDETIWNDFLTMRKVKGAPVTETALAGLEREAKKSGLSLADVLAMCCARGWRGFKAEWAVDERLRQDGPPAETAYQRSMRERWEEATGRRSSGREVIDITTTQELLP